MADDLEKIVEEASLEHGGGQQAIDVSSNPELYYLQQLADSDPSIKETDEYKALMQGIKPSSTSTDDEDEIDEEEEEIEDEDEEDEDDDSSDPFGLSKPAKKEQKLKIDFTLPKEADEFIQKHFGIKNQETFFNSVKTWREQAQEGSEEKKRHQALQDDLSALPPIFKRGINAWANNEDWESVISGSQSRLNWESGFQNQEKEALVQHYLGEEYDDLVSQLNNSEIDEAEFDKQIAIYARATRDSFSRDKQALDDERANYQARIAEDTKRFKASAISSVESLKKAYPNFKNSEVNSIRNTLVEGKLDDLFFNPDGTYKEDVAELIAFAKYGKQMVELLQKKGERRGENNANLKHVDTSPKKLRQQKDSNHKRSNDEGLKAVEHLRGQLGRKSIF